MTGFTSEEFEALLPTFEYHWNECILESKFFYRQRKLRKQRVQSGESPGFVPIVFTGTDYSHKYVRVDKGQQDTTPMEPIYNTKNNYE